MLRGLERIKKRYGWWLIISAILLYLIFEYNLQKYLLLIVVILLLKDLFIDLGLFGVYQKRGPTPDWLEHFPFVFLVAFGGFSGYLDMPQLVAWIAAVDAVVDFLDDMGWI